jgi:hypothetical protein
MLNEIINKVVQKTGISEEHATAAVATVVDFLKSKLPAPLASQIEGFLNGNSGISGAVGGAKDAASDVFGSAKDALGSFFNKK